MSDVMTELYLIGLLEYVQTELQHCRVFVSTKERIHPVGLEQYDSLIKEVSAAVKAYRGGKWQLHLMNKDLMEDMHDLPEPPK